MIGSVDSDVGDEAEPGSASPALLYSTRVCPSAEDEYVFSIRQTCDNSSVLVSMSNQCVIVLDPATLQPSRSIMAHTDRINTIESMKDNPYMFGSASDDRSCRIWDLRCVGSSPCMQFCFESEVQACSFGLEDTLLACSNVNSLYFFDIRFSAAAAVATAMSSMRNCLYSYEDLHTDEVTGVSFLPSSPDFEGATLLASASDDGLICVHDVSIQDPDEVTASTLNVGCPIRSFGLFGRQNEGMYCLSSVEGLTCWHVPTGIRIANYESIRDDFGVDYLVDCVYNAPADELQLCCGTFDGRMAMMTIAPNIELVDKMDADAAPVSTSTPPLLVTMYPGHSAQIRCCHQLQSAAGSMRALTGGEDGIICLWKLN